MLFVVVRSFHLHYYAYVAHPLFINVQLRLLFYHHSLKPPNMFLWIWFHILSR